MKKAEEIIAEIQDSIAMGLEFNGYLMRGDVIEIFDKHRMDWRSVAGDTEASFTIGSAKLSQLPKPHIVIDHTNQTSLEFKFPSGDIVQTMTVRGFA